MAHAPAARLARRLWARDTNMPHRDGCPPLEAGQEVLGQVVPQIMHPCLNKPMPCPIILNPEGNSLRNESADTTLGLATPE